MPAAFRPISELASSVSAFAEEVVNAALVVVSVSLHLAISFVETSRSERARERIDGNDVRVDVPGPALDREVLEARRPASASTRCPRGFRRVGITPDLETRDAPWTRPLLTVSPRASGWARPASTRRRR